MLNFVTIASSAIKSTQRVLKFLRYGLSDVQTADEVAPFGLDSNPTKDMIAIYGSTDDEPVIIGYLNKNQLAAIGEFRTYSTDENGQLKFYIWQKNNGTCEIGGSSDNMVRYSKLEDAFNELNDKFNDFANTYVPGGPSSVGLPAVVEPSTADITGAKIDEIKTL